LFSFNFLQNGGVLYCNTENATQVPTNIPYAWLWFSDKLLNFVARDKNGMEFDY
jgi:hypothetical protein